MKILFIKSGIHHKNLHFILNCKQITFHIIDNVNEIQNLDLSEFDVVYSPCQPIDVSKYPNTKFIFGPHFSVFPHQHQMNMIKGKNSIYIQPSEWVRQLWINSPYCADIKINPFSFGVDTYKFNEIKYIESCRIQDQVTLVRTNLPHSITMGPDPRWSISARTHISEDMLWEDVVELFRSKNLLIER